MEQTYFENRGGNAKQVDAESAVEAFRSKASHLSAEASRDLRHDAESMRIFKSKSFLND
ncbi:hypothetical protein DPMN_007628 [Dreissena polymorpha]|uniref:Uncharacterized protein n=1 Tax=Dreissena polymorpha TaxID=45954 RepID=A0A9D4MTY7_DREPO|nr:hypothetical protein DPMN_007628 [Dreissena polymorpha]